MGKRIIQQARGHGSLTYRVRRRAYRYRVGYPVNGGKIKGDVLKILNSPGHSAPLVKIKAGKDIFFNVAANELREGQEIETNSDEIKNGNIVEIGKIPIGTKIFNIEVARGDGGKIIRTSGSYAVVTKKFPGKTAVFNLSKKEIIFKDNSRATIGEIAASGRVDKPLTKAGTKWHMMKARNKLWPRTSAVKMNAVDHPFGSGRGKRIKSKIAKRNAPPGARVGLLRPRRTGRR